MDCSKKLSPIKLDMTFIKEHFKPFEKEEYSEAIIVCRIFDIREQSMRAFELSNGKQILLAKQDGRIYALSNRCTHYGAPLHMGVLGNKRIRCPWHGACFNLETGDIEDFPAFCRLQTYKVDVINDFWIGIRKNLKDQESRDSCYDMCEYDPNNKTTFIILGGGAAGGICVESLRHEGFTGRIIMVSHEPYLPYDRAKLTKYLYFNSDTYLIRSMEFYKKNNITVHLGMMAVKANMAEKTVTLSNDLELHYDKLFIATGCTPKRPNFKGADLKNIFTIHDYDDLVKIRASLSEQRHVVCLGGGFLGVEMSETIRRHYKCRVSY